MAAFEIVTRAEQPTAVMHQTVPMEELPRFIGRAFGAVIAAMNEQGVTPAGEPFAMYLRKPTETVEVEAGFPVTRPVRDLGDVHPGRLPGGKIAHGLHVGSYDTLTRTYDELMRWMAAQQVKPHDEMWEVYHSDPQREPEPSTWRTEIFWPVD